jgi:branched-chain amino acid transport system substrate-binding protein
VQVQRILLVTAVAIIVVARPAAQAETLVGFAAPLTGDLSWHGELGEQAVQLAVADLNEAGGVLGEMLSVVSADDFCDPDQARSAARKLIGDDVAVVIGHPCSSTAIPASQVYADAAVLMITFAASNPRLTEQGFRSVFRVVGRDDRQAVLAADYLADHWSGEEIAILHDGRAFGQGIAEQTREQLRERSVEPTLYEAIEPGERDYFDVIDKMRSLDIEVVYFGGYAAEAGLILRQADSMGYDLHLISGDNLNTEFFWQVSGPAGEGTRFTSFPDWRDSRKAADVLQRFRDRFQEPQGVSLYAYAATQVWAQAVEEAGTFKTEAVARALRSHEFETILGTIGFDEKGDVTGYETYAWYVWKNGNYTPVDPAD